MSIAERVYLLVNQVDVDSQIMVRENFEFIRSLQRCWIVLDESMNNNSVSQTLKRFPNKKQNKIRRVSHLVDGNGYDRNFKSNGISGSMLLYFTLHTNSDL